MDFRQLESLIELIPTQNAKDCAYKQAAHRLYFYMFKPIEATPECGFEGECGFQHYRNNTKHCELYKIRIARKNENSRI